LNAYFDTAYIAKCYLNEPDSKPVRDLAFSLDGLYSSAWCIAELACVFQRHVREAHLTRAQATRLRDFFLEDVQDGVWSLLPISERFLFRVESLVSVLPKPMYLRAGDAVHLAAAQSLGFGEIWSNDRHVLQAAPAFGLTGKSV
jgi:predicted nucleic acid-binding protein